MLLILLIQNNKPETGDLEIVKTSTDGKIKDISFKVEKSQSGNWAQLGIYKTDASGKISITGLAVGTVLRVTEIVPDGYECTSENPQTITLKRGTNRLEFYNKPTTTDCEIIKVSDDGKVKDITFTVKDSSGTVIFSGKTDKNGKINVPGLTIGETYTFIETVPEDYVAEKREQTVKMKSTGNTVTFTNHPVSRLELIKQSDDNNVSGLSFKLEQFEPEGGIGWWTVGTYQTDQNGMITEDILYGYKYRITETVPDDYVCENRVQEFIAATGTNTVHFINHPTSRLELIKTSDDGNVRGISFTLEQFEPEGGIGWWTVGTYQTDQNGKITEDLLYGYKYRVTETVPEDYVCDNRVQEFTAQTGTNTVTFVNHPIVKLELIKSADNGHVADIGFKFEKYDAGLSKWVLMDTYQTDADGKIHLEDLSVGLRLRITELVPAGYQTETVTKEITLVRGTNTVSFENYRIYGDLELIKVDESYPDTTLSGAEFTVTITYPGREPAEVPMPEVLDDQGNGTGVYRLEHIEYGSVCVVRETKAPEGFELSDKSFTVTIEEAKTYSIGDPGFDCVTNREKSGKIQIKKVDTQGRAMPGVSFLLEFSLDGTNWAPVTFRETDSAVTAGGCTNQNLDHGILVTDRNGLAVYPGLALSLGDRVLHYRLTEVSTQNGMQLLSEPAFEGTLPYNGAEEITVTAVNTEGFTIPATGGAGFVSTAIGVSLAGTAALALLLLLRKKKGAAA